MSPLSSLPPILGRCGPRTLDCVVWPTDYPPSNEFFNPLVVPWKEPGAFEAITATGKETSKSRFVAGRLPHPASHTYDVFDGAHDSEGSREMGPIAGGEELPSEHGVRSAAELLCQMGYEPLSSP